MTVEEIRAELEQNERDRNRLSGELARATDAAQLAYDTYKAQESVPEGGSFFINSVRYDDKNDYLNALYNDFEQKAAARRELAVEFNNLFPEKERLEGELAAAQEAAQAATTDTAARRDQGPGINSAGNIVEQATNARDEGALPQNPPPPPTDESEIDANQPTNATPIIPDAVPALDTPTTLPGAQDAQGGNIDLITNNTATSAVSGVNTLQVGTPQSTTQNYVYKMITCTSKFSGGKFTQELEGALLMFPDGIPKTTNTGAAARGPDQSDAETARLARQNAAAADQVQGRTATGAVGDPGGVNVEGEFGAFFGDGTTTAPTVPNVGLATVLDQRKGTPEVPTSQSLWELEGFGDPTSLGAAESAPATSDGAAVNLPENRNSQGAPTNASVNVFLTDGSVIQVTSQADLSDLFGADEISRAEYLKARRALEVKQQLQTPAANQRSPQQIARET